MANLGNLIVRGVTRILGDAYANKFIGNLQGNADTATSAIKASTADSATSAASANKASIATAVQDYGTSDYREIKIGYNGSGLSSSTITHAVGFTDGGTKIKDISKDEFRNWLATASGTWGISITGNAGYASSAGYADSAGNANTIDGYYETYFYRHRGSYGKSYTAASTEYNLGPGTYTTSEEGFSGTLLSFNSSESASAIQFWTHYSQGNLYYRTSIDSNRWGKTDGSWTRILDSDSYNYYAPTLTGSGASGTWDISITGNAATATNADLLDGYHASSLSKIAAISLTPSQVLRIDMSSHMRGLLINMQSTNAGRNALYFVTGYGDGTIIRNDIRVIKGGPYNIYFNGESENACVYIVGTSLNANPDLIYINPFDYNDVTYTIVSSVPSDAVLVSSSNSNILATLNSNVASSSKWETPRTITLTGSVTGSVSIDGSQNVSLATTTNHTHTFASITSKPTTINGYGITDGLRRVTLANNVENDFNTFENLTLTGRGDPTTGSSLLNSPWTTQPAGGFGVLTYLWSGYGLQLAAGYASNDIYIRNKYYTGGGSSWDTRWDKILNSSNFNSYAPKLDGTGATGTWGISITGNAASATNASTVNGISLTYNGQITSSQWIAAWESGTSIRAMSAYNTFISMCSYLDEGSSDVTDGTMFITSYATDNGFADPNGKNKPYKRKASFLWNYINNKCSSIYATQSWVNSNYYTCSESDSRYIQSETDPVWTAAKGNYYTKTECNNRYIQSETDPIWTADKVNYYTKTECNNKFQPKGTYLTEQNLQGYATQEWVRGEEYLYRSGGTMDARAEIGITTKLFIGNSTSPDTCYTKFNCILHGGGDESNPNWVIHDNGYAEFKSSVSANAFYASSDIRLKNILDDINIDFDKLKLIPKKYYTWKGSDILQLGTIAQDIQKIYPEVVSKNENGYLSVDYSKLSIIALAAIDKLNERIKELECQIKL